MWILIIQESIQGKWLSRCSRENFSNFGYTNGAEFSRPFPASPITLLMEKTFFVLCKAVITMIATSLPIQSSCQAITHKNMDLEILEVRALTTFLHTALATRTMIPLGKHLQSLNYRIASRSQQVHCSALHLEHLS